MNRLGLHLKFEYRLNFFFTCGYVVGNTWHYFLHCSNYLDESNIRLKKIRNVENSILLNEDNNYYQDANIWQRNSLIKTNYVDWYSNCILRPFCLFVWLPNPPSFFVLCYSNFSFFIYTVSSSVLLYLITTIFICMSAEMNLGIQKN